VTTATQDRALTAEEWALVCALREIPAGALRDTLAEVVHDLVERVCEPRCAEYQADGVSCAVLGVACERCQQVGGMLNELKAWLLPRVVSR